MVPKTPDWRDASAYPVPGETTMEDWATQFAWRNPSYRQTWVDSVAWVEAKPELKGAGGVHVSMHVAMDHGWVRRVGRFEPDMFGLGRGPMNYCHVSQGGTMGMPKHPRLLDIRFNLEAPIDPQLKEAKELLNTFKNELKESGKIEPWDTKTNDRHFCLYLRLLDAEEAGSTMDEIIQVFQTEYPDIYGKSHRLGKSSAKKQYNNNLNAAKKLRDGGFEKLLWIGGGVD